MPILKICFGYGIIYLYKWGMDAMEQVSIGFNRLNNDNIKRDSNLLCGKSLKVIRNQRLSPVNGYELPFRPELWADQQVRDSTNCYAYVIGKRKGFEVGFKLQPGNLSGEVEYPNTYNYLIRMINRDMDCLGRNFSPITYEKKCPPGMHKIALVYKPKRVIIGGRIITTEEVSDYHLYVQNQDGTWSHKLINNIPTNADSRDEVIINPQTANNNYRKWGAADYDTFGGYYAIEAK